MNCKTDKICYSLAMFAAAAAMLFVSPAIAVGPTPVSGNISSTTWNIAGSPYIVTGNVNVALGVTLTIDAGVSVEFSAGKSLIVAGRLNAVGTPSNMIVFSASVEAAPMGYWGMIEFVNTASSASSFEYCVVKDSLNGVRLSAFPLKLKNSSFQNNKIAMTIYSANAFLLSGVSFVSNEVGVSFFSKSLNVDMVDGYFNKNSVGVRLDLYSTLGISTTIFSSNEIGLVVRGYASAEIDHSDILFNKTGISVESGGAISVINSRVNSSESVGLRFAGQADAVLLDNTMLNNRSTISAESFSDIDLTLGRNTIVSSYGVDNGGHCGIYLFEGTELRIPSLFLKMFDNEIIGTRVYLLWNGLFSSDSYIERNRIISGYSPGTYAPGVGLNTRFGPCPIARFNTIQGWDTGTGVSFGSSLNYEGMPPNVFRFNDLSNNYFGVASTVPPYWDMRNNYWGGTGPNPPGNGSRISGHVISSPWLASPIASSSSELISDVKIYRNSNYTQLLTGIATVGVVDRVFISVEASTVSTVAINWTSVLVTSEADPTGILLYLTETASNSGIYNGEVRLNGGSSSVFGSLISAEAGKTVSFASSFNRSKRTSVPVGRLARWTMANSPELLFQVTLTLPQGSTLEISPSVEVRCWPRKINESTDLADQLLIYGNLIASGEPASRIKFTSGFAAQFPGDWSRVALSGSAARGVFRFCDVEYGTDAIKVVSLATAEFTACKFYRNANSGLYCDNSNVLALNNEFNNNSIGMSIYNIGAQTIVRVLNNNFFNNGQSLNQGGIYIKNASAYINGNNFSLNKLGIFADSDSTANVPYVRFNNFVDNTSSGIFNNSMAYPFSAPLNWWGTMEGPDVVDSRISLPPPRSPKRGDNVSAFVYFEPYLLYGPVGYNPPTDISSVVLERGNGVLERMSITLYGTDASLEARNWTSVKISTEADPSGVVVDLVETNIGTGTFEGTVRLVGNPGNADLGLIRARPGESVFVSSVAFPLISQSKVVSSVGTWELNDSPEILERGIAYSLEAGSRLNIQAGVTVEFDDGAGLYINRGVLYASGEAGNKITFTSRRASPTAGIWKSIRFSSSESAGSILSNCELAYATEGIVLDTDASLVLRNNVIRNSSLFGIRIYSRVKPRIESNLIKDNQIGIYSDTAYPNIFGNDIRNNSNGIYDLYSYYSTIEANSISSNEYGIYVQPRATAGSGFNLIRGNTIEAGQNSSVRYCIYAKTRDPLVRFNNLVGFDGDDYGVYMEMSSYPVDARYNYWSSALVGPNVVSEPKVPGRLSYSPPTSVASVRLFKNKACTVDTTSCGILDRAFVSLAATSEDPNYNYTTVIVSNESDPAKGKIFIDVLESSNGNFSGEARLNDNSDDWTDMMGSKLNDNIGFYSAVTPSKSDSLNVSAIATWEKADTPETFRNKSSYDPRLPSGSILMVEPGATVESGTNNKITIYGTLEARGQKLARIIFTSFHPARIPGSWVGINFNTTGNGLIAYSDIKYAYTGVDIYIASPMLAMVSIESCSDSGLALQYNSSPRIVDCYIVSNEVGVKGGNYTGSAKLNFNNLLNPNHLKYGVNNILEAWTVTLEATNNYWDAANGPRPTGGGLYVSSKVNYLPFTTEANIPGGPIASAPWPASGEAINRSMITLEAKLFDPEDVYLPSVTIEVNGVKVPWGSNLSYEASTFRLHYTPTVPFTEGVKTFEVVFARDTFNEELRSKLFSTFIIDLTSPEVNAVTALPYFVKAGNILVTVESTDWVSGIDHSATPEVRVRYGNYLSNKAIRQSYSSGSFKGLLTILPTFENGYATLEVSNVRDLAGNIHAPSLEAAHVFIDTKLPTVEVLSPFGGVTLEGPSTYLISWEGVSDEAPASGFGPTPISIWLIVPGGAIPIASALADTRIYSWSVPQLNTSDCRIRVDVVDRAGNVFHGYSPSFSIQTQNPVIVSTDPSNESTSVSPSTPISISFSRAMSPESVENVFTITPYVAGTFEWSGDDKTLSYLPLNRLSFSTTYETGIGAGAIDKNGNLLFGAPVAFDFTTIFPESIKPTISNVRFDGRSYMDNDVISNRPRVSAKVSDEGGTGVEAIDITIRLGPYVLKPSTYEESSGSMETQVVDYPLGFGSYVVSIEAVDRAGNHAVPFAGRVRVIGGPVSVLGAPMAYPAPFKPMSGAMATIAYTLSTSADITVYMYDLGGRAVLTRKFGAGLPGGVAGYNSFQWNGVSELGSVVGNGIYVFKVVSGRRVLGTGKLVVYD